MPQLDAVDDFTLRTMLNHWTKDRLTVEDAESWD